MIHHLFPFKTHKTPIRPIKIACCDGYATSSRNVELTTSNFNDKTWTFALVFLPYVVSCPFLCSRLLTLDARGHCLLLASRSHLLWPFSYYGCIVDSPPLWWPSLGYMFDSCGWWGSFLMANSGNKDVHSFGILTMKMLMIFCYFDFWEWSPYFCWNEAWEMQLVQKPPSDF